MFRGTPSRREEIEARLDESQEKRRTTQPSAKSAGCIFKNPETCPAGKLVDELGLKNSRVGNARVSEVHGNFIVNEGGATAAEMLELIDQIKKAAKAKRGIELETEVQIVGEPRVDWEVRAGLAYEETRLTKKIAVLMGGPGSERDVSLATGRGVSKALRSFGAKSTEVDVRDENFPLPHDVDLAFIAFTEPSAKTARCKKFSKIAASPTPVKVLRRVEIAFDKILSKEKFLERGVVTPDWEVIDAGQRPTMPVPLVVKPPRQGSTVGS